MSDEQKKASELSKYVALSQNERPAHRFDVPPVDLWLVITRNTSVGSGPLHFEYFDRAHDAQRRVVTLMVRQFGVSVQGDNTDYFTVRSVWRLIDGDWVEIEVVLNQEWGIL